MCRITVYYGDNASGKTRKSLEQALHGNLNRDKLYRGIITNLPYIKTTASFSPTRDTLVNESDCMDAINFDIEVNGENRDATKAKQMMDLMSLNGDTLLIDDIDSEMSNQYTIYVLNFIRDNSYLWDRVIINGYSPYLTLVFGDEEKDIRYVDNSGNVHEVSEAEIYNILDNI